MTTRESQLETENQALRRENQLLHQKVDLLIRRIFGSSSERLDSAQMQLLLQAEQTAAPSLNQPVTPVPAKPVAPERQRQPPQPRLPENLPVVEEVLEPEPVKADPQAWRRIGQEISEQLDYEPGRFLRRRLIRPTYVHRKNNDLAPVTAPLPARLQERCIATPALIAHVVVSKLCDHIPLHRLEYIFKSRYQVRVPRQTLDRWIHLGADWLAPIYQQIRTGVMAGGYVQLDETPIDYLEPGFGRTKQGYLWVGKKPDGEVFFQWETSRAAQCLERLVPADFKGTIQCDGYAGYQSFVKARKAIKLAACWAHARRKFFEAAEQSSRLANWFLHQIQHLYQIEAKLRTHKAGPQLRLAVRTHQSRPILERISKAMTRIQTVRRPLPQSLLGKAIAYTQNLWQELQVYLEDGRIEIDNNLVENAIRPTAVGKNYAKLSVMRSSVQERRSCLA